jgi:hypothetical protein
MLLDKKIVNKFLNVKKLPYFSSASKSKRNWPPSWKFDLAMHSGIGFNPPLGRNEGKDLFI